MTENGSNYVIMTENGSNRVNTATYAFLLQILIN